MGRWLTSPRAPWILTVVLLALLSLLAALQYRWTGELSRAERQGKAAALQEGLERIALDFDRRLMVIFLSMARPLRNDDAANSTETPLAVAWRDWRAESSDPQLIRSLYVLESSLPSGDGPRSGNAEARRARHLASPDGTWTESPWPEALRDGPGFTEDFRRMGRRGRRGEPRGPQLLNAEIPALIVPVPGDSPSHFRRPRQPPRFIVVELDRTALQTLLEQLIARHLTGNRDGTAADDPGAAAPPEFVLRLVDRRDTVLWSQGESGGRLPSQVDGETKLFSLRPIDELEPRQDPALSALLTLRRGIWDDPRMTPPKEGGRGADAPPRAYAASQLRTLLTWPRETRQSQWRLLATHAAGSLDAAVDAARRRNLWISSGICALLALSLGLLLVSTRRAQVVARQQLEFVAGVTHELMTPLAALRSAGENLADGVVREPAQVVRYGRLVDREGRRLSAMVAQILELSGMQSGHHALSFKAVDPAAIVRGALQDCRSELQSHAFDVETNLPDSPAVDADAEALRRALVNLIHNAVKYASDGAWLRITAQPRGRHIDIVVEDRGPGIGAADLPHLFEPFRRGDGMAASSIPGSGLGLSLVKSIVEAHGGEVAADNRHDERGSVAGARFTVTLPLSKNAPEPLPPAQSPKETPVP